MTSRWIVVAHNAGADIFTSEGKGRNPRLWRHVEHGAGRKMERELVADRPGRAFDRAGQGRHAMESRHTSREHESEIFARELGAFLDRGHDRGTYGELVLVAPPGFLGVLRRVLSERVRGCVVATVAKNLAGCDARTVGRVASAAA
jgi:protein required for attachment to host cells